MKKILLLIFVLATVTCFGQELKLNDSSKYEYTEVVDKVLEKDSFVKKLKELNYTDLEISESEIIAYNFVSESIMSFSVEMKYRTTIEFKESRHRIKISNIIIKDHKSTFNLEDMKSQQKKWVKNFNSKLPKIISDLKDNNNNDDW